MKADGVTLAYVHPNEVSHSFHQSIVGVLSWDMGHEGHLLQGGWLAMRYGADGLPAARNKAVEGFLDERDGEWLLWVDTDMGFEPDTVDRLLDAADPETRPIVGGLCFAQKERMPDQMGGYRCTANPTIFDWVKTPEGPSGFMARSSYPINTLLRCSGTGSALILIHRSVFERVKKEHGPVWYNRVPNSTMNGELVGEDLSFCLRAGALDIPIYVHTGIRASHYKSFWLSEQDYWSKAIAPPAKERVDVLVPVMKRPQNAAPFMDSLRASTGMATVYAIGDRGDVDTLDAWEKAGAKVLTLDAVPGKSGTFAEKVNEGFRQTGEPWVFICGDDVRFHAAWLDQAEAVAGDTHHVIGTNDLTNPRVLRGEHATHMLIRRSYVDSVGASWDGPGKIAHEGYRHWFVDDEIVTAAKQREVFAMALGSIVEHMHPLFGKAKDDEVYELGRQSTRRDKKLFGERAHANYAKRAA